MLNWIGILMAISIFWTSKLDERYISNLNGNIREGNSIMIKCPREY